MAGWQESFSRYPHGGYFYFILLQKRKDKSGQRPLVKKMKKTLKQTVAILLALVLMMALVSCNNEEKDVWENAVYTEDQTFGEGAKTIVVEVQAQDKTVTFTVKTDKETVGEALLEHGLIAGDEGPYGMYVKAVNGMTADYDVDQRYWAFYMNGEISMTGVDVTAITEGATYQMVYSK